MCMTSSRAKPPQVAHRITDFVRATAGLAHTRFPGILRDIDAQSHRERLPDFTVRSGKQYVSASLNTSLPHLRQAMSISLRERIADPITGDDCGGARRSSLLCSEQARVPRAVRRRVSAVVERSTRKFLGLVSLNDLLKARSWHLEEESRRERSLRFRFFRLGTTEIRGD
jgi:hypothetical protein